VTAVLPSVSTDRPPPAVAVLPDLDSGTEFLTVTAHPVPPSAVVITVRGEVDLVTSPLLRDRLLAHLHDTAPQMIVDLTKVGFLGAAGLTALLTARQAATAAGITLCVVAHTRPVLLPLTITGLDGVFDIYPDLAQALLRSGCGPDG
jgi:anti-sigma B factor antagonist